MMDKSLHARDGFRTQSVSSASIRDVRYSCGYCGYELNLSSSSRNTASIGSKYSKSIKGGLISFFDIDESRFRLVKEFQCVPFLFHHRTKLLCRKCGNLIGTTYKKKTPLSVGGLVSDEPNLESHSCKQVTTSPSKYDVKIRALQPSTSEESQFSLLCNE